MVAAACVTLIGTAEPPDQVAAAEPQALPVARAIRISDRMVHWQPVTCIAFSPNGRYIASGSDRNTVIIWDEITGTRLATLSGHDEAVTSIAFNADGTRLASGSLDASIRIWDTANGTNLATLRGHEDSVRSLAFSPDGMTLASVSDRAVKLWYAQPLPLRLDQRRDALAARTEALPFVERLFDIYEDARRVADEVRRDKALTEELRRQALNLVLRIAVVRRGAQSDSGDGHDQDG